MTVPTSTWATEMNRGACLVGRKVRPTFLGFFGSRGEMRESEECDESEREDYLHAYRVYASLSNESDETMRRYLFRILASEAIQPCILPRMMGEYVVAV